MVSPGHSMTYGTDRSYDADEENEVSFREGDRIVKIEPVSDDWWQGRTADGSVGLFPGMISFAHLCVVTTY